MMAIRLMRDRLRPLYERAVEDVPVQEPHPGLLLQRGLAEHRSDGDGKGGVEHIRNVSRSAAGSFYRRAFARWRRATADPMRFRSVILKTETRLFMGLNCGGMLETGCMIGHSHGMPYVPGSSVKGAIHALARERFNTTDGETVCDDLFGASATGERPAGLAGLITFHDAWWVPDSAESPLVPEIVTTHHPEYYGRDGNTRATDFDSPIPNAQIAIRGAFLFVIEGPIGWLPLAEQMLIDTLSTRGAGARTRSGYGFFSPSPEAPTKPRCEWVDETIADLVVKHRTREEATLRSKGLAEAWSALDDPALKEAAFADIRSRWQEKGWWDEVQGRSARQAREIYAAWQGGRDEAP